MSDLRKWVTGTADRLGVTGANSNQLARRSANTKAHNYQGTVSVNAENGHNKNIL